MNTKSIVWALGLLLFAGAIAAVLDRDGPSAGGLSSLPVASNAPIAVSVPTPLFRDKAPTDVAPSVASAQQVLRDYGAGALLEIGTGGPFLQALLATSGLAAAFAWLVWGIMALMKDGVLLAIGVVAIVVASVLQALFRHAGRAAQAMRSAPERQANRQADQVSRASRQE